MQLPTHAFLCAGNSFADFLNGVLREDFLCKSHLGNSLAYEPFGIVSEFVQAIPLAYQPPSIDAISIIKPSVIRIIFAVMRCKWTFDEPVLRNHNPFIERDFATRCD